MSLRRCNSSPASMHFFLPYAEAFHATFQEMEEEEMEESPAFPLDIPELSQSCPAFLKLPPLDSEDEEEYEEEEYENEESEDDPGSQATVPTPPAMELPIHTTHTHCKPRVSFCHDPYGWAVMDLPTGPASCPPTPSANVVQQQLRNNMVHGIHGGALLAFHISQALAEVGNQEHPRARGGSDDEGLRNSGTNRNNAAWSILGSEELSEWDDTQSCSTEASRSAMPLERDGPAMRIAPCVLPLVPEMVERRRAFLTHPIPKACGSIQCTIQRDRRLMGTRYLLSLEIPAHPLLVVDERGREFVDSNVERATSVFLCAARKLGGRSCYLISADRDDFDKHGRAYVGKCRKTSPMEYMASAIDLDNFKEESAEVRKRHLAAISFTESSKDIPSQVKVTLPTDDLSHGPVEASPQFLLRSTPPVWNPQTKAYELDMGPRVRLASSKNLQLEDVADVRRSIRLTFGKADENGNFVLDFAHPLSVVQAFSIALASFDVL